jgi:hypothetical protein
MALGHYDATTGVWVYDEDDRFATFSARLNKLGASVIAAGVLARHTTLEARAHHAEWTFTSNAVPDTAVTGGALALVTAATTDSSFASISGSTLVLAAGVSQYDAVFKVSTGALTGRTFAQLSIGGLAVNRQSSQAGEDTWSVSGSFRITSAGTAVTPQILKTSGGTPNVTGTFRLNKTR